MNTDRPLKPLSAYPQHLVRTASWRREVIQPLVDAKQLTRSIVRQRVLEINAQLRESGAEAAAKQVSIASLYRWICAFRRSEGDLRSLIPYVRQDTAPAKTRLSPAVDTIIETVIRDLYWSREQVSIALVQHNVLLRIQEVNHAQPEQDQLAFPSGTTIFRRLRAWKSRQGEITSLSLRRTSSNRSQQRAEQSTTTFSESRWSEAHASTAHRNQGNILGRKKTPVEQRAKQDPPLDPKQWRTMLPSQRLGLIESLFIEHHRLKPLMTEFHALAQSADATEANVPHCLAVLGEAGVGKTALAKIWIKSASRQLCQLNQGEQMRPYRYLSLPVPATPKGILASFLLELEGTPVSLRGTEWNMMERLQRAIRTTSVRLLFIDDMQHLLNRETQRIRYACVEILEHIIKQTGMSMIFLGSLNETEPVFRVSPRLERLVGTPRLLRPFEWNPKNGATMQEFRMLLRTIDRYLPFDLSGLDEEEIASGFFSATDGILGWIMKLIRYAAGQAIQEQEATLSKPRLAAAYDACITQTTLGFGKQNPFTPPDSLSMFLGHREERPSHYYAKRMERWPARDQKEEQSSEQSKSR